MHGRRWRTVALAALALGVVALAARLPRVPGDNLPGAQEAKRTLLCVWDVSGPTGSSAWLKNQIAAYEKACPGVSVYLRSVPVTACFEVNTVLPDVIVYETGTFDAPEKIFVPLEGEDGLRQELVQSGKWKNELYGLPLAMEGWVLTVDGGLMPGNAATPMPTTLLGKPAPTVPSEPVLQPEIPWTKLREQALPMAAASGNGLFSLTLLRGEERSVGLPDTPLTQAQVYAAFASGGAGCALLTTGQLAALETMITQGKRGSAEVFVPSGAIAPKVLYASATRNAGSATGGFLSYLTQHVAQKELIRQNLFTVRTDTALYATGAWAAMERAMARALCPLNAFLPPTQTETAARQSFSGASTLEEALLPLK